MELMDTFIQLEMLLDRDDLVVELVRFLRRGELVMDGKLARR